MPSSTPPKAPQLIFGCASRGLAFPNRAAAEKLLDTLQAFGTRALHPPDIGAAQRRLLGPGEEAGAAAAQLGGSTVDSQVMVSIRQIVSEESTTTEENVGDTQFGEDGKMHVFYALAPDAETPLRDQAAEADARYKKGLFSKFSVVNFPAKMLEAYFEICEREGYAHYNLIDRRHGGAVMHTVRRHGMTFVAHSPHAGGFLTESLVSGLTGDDDSMLRRPKVEGSRLDERRFMPREARRYDTERHRAAVRALDELLARGRDLHERDVAVRWLVFHSRLGPEDVIMFGGSSIGRILRTKVAIGRGPLPDALVAGLDEIWRALVSTG
ncbi:hypothetical protein PG993_003797 [Apiospora rasikravindrae]|uniref:NADP-dependent oxidoreductase domain-containing protein n=1 Tax=Apiospora rasikravindrae TaxID=990691 RepID=A0ABR1U0J8_9PEZI